MIFKNLFALSLIAFSFHANAQCIIEHSANPPMSEVLQISIIDPSTIAQGFKAPCSGNLESATFKVFSLDFPTVAAGNFRIIEGSTPSGTVLHTQAFSELTFTEAGEEFTFTLDSNVALTEGASYVFEFDYRGSLTGELVGTYFDGDYFVDGSLFPGVDLDFKIAITDMPIVSSNNELTKHEILKVYPNPSTDFVNILLTEEFTDFEVTLYSNQGTVILQAKNAKQIDLSHIAAGVYSLVVTTANKRFSQKIVKRG